MNYLAFNDDGFPVLLSGGTPPSDAVKLNRDDFNTLQAAMSRGASITKKGKKWTVTEPPETPPPPVQLTPEDILQELIDAGVLNTTVDAVKQKRAGMKR